MILLVFRIRVWERRANIIIIIIIISLRASFNEKFVYFFLQCRRNRGAAFDLWLCDPFYFMIRYNGRVWRARARLSTICMPSVITCTVHRRAASTALSQSRIPSFHDPEGMKIDTWWRRRTHTTAHHLPCSIKAPRIQQKKSLELATSISELYMSLGFSSSPSECVYLCDTLIRLAFSSEINDAKARRSIMIRNFRIIRSLACEPLTRTAHILINSQHNLFRTHLYFSFPFLIGRRMVNEQTRAPHTPSFLSIHFEMRQ